MFVAGVLAASTAAWERPNPLTLLVVGALLVALDPLSTVQLGRAVTVSAGFPVSLAAVILLGPGGAALISLAGLVWQPDRPPRSKRLFNASALALCAAGAAVVYRTLGGHQVLTAADFPRVLPIFVVTALSYAAINAALVAGVLALAEGVPLRRALRITLSTGVVGYLLHGMFGLLMAALWSGELGAFTAVLVVAPTLVARWALTQSVAEREAYQRTVRALVQAVETKDNYTRGHSERVARGAELIGRQIGMAEERVELLRFAGMLHDMGKLAVPTALLHKPGDLTAAEYAQLAQHPLAGLEMIRDIGFLREAGAGIMHHHERMDGSGYPLGLRGEEIPEFARVVAVADAFDAMTSTRSYRRARTVPQALAELRAGAGEQFDPVLVEAFALAIADAGWEPAAPDDSAVAGDIGFDHDDPAGLRPIVGVQAGRGAFPAQAGPASPRRPAGAPVASDV